MSVIFVELLGDAWDSRLYLFSSVDCSSFSFMSVLTFLVAADSLISQEMKVKTDLKASLKNAKCLVCWNRALLKFKLIYDCVILINSYSNKILI